MSDDERSQRGAHLRAPAAFSSPTLTAAPSPTGTAPCRSTATSSRSTPAAPLHRFTDVLVIGAGIAGLRAALEVPPDLDVLVVTKDRVTESNSTYAQGGIAGVLSPEDRFENHIEDTLVAGAGLCDRDVVETGRPRGPGRRSTT